jgi:DNA polymerase-4
MRRILHLDMDAFYASVEQRDNPELRGRPVVVGGAPDQRGVVAAASYEARAFGVRSAMPSVRARRLCPDLLFVRPRFDAYRVASRQVRAIFARFTHIIEPVSLDEAYLDVTEPLLGPMPAVDVARRIKAAVFAETGLTASAGASFNRFLAKLASDLEKPDGLVVIRPEAALAFIAGLPIERFQGVGPATARRMRALGISSGADLQERGEPELVAAFGRLGRHYWRIAHAQDDRPVEPARRRRSLSVETTFDRDLSAEGELADELARLAATLATRLASSGFAGRTLGLKLRYADFRTVTRRTTRALPFARAEELLTTGCQLLARRPRPGVPLRLIGLGVASEGDERTARQLALPLTATCSAGP